MIVPEQAFGGCGRSGLHRGWKSVRRTARDRLASILIAILLGSSIPAAAQQQRARDAAEAVQEGDVAQWLKYYERQREASRPEVPPDQRAPQPQSEEAAAASREPPPPEADQKR